MTWLETNEELRENVPKKSIENLHIQHELMDFNSKAIAKLTDMVGKTFDRCMDFHKRVLTTHNRCQTSIAKRLQEFPGQEENLKYLHNMMQEDELNRHQVKGLN